MAWMPLFINDNSTLSHPRILNIPKNAKLLVYTRSWSLAVQRYLFSEGYTWDDNSTELDPRAFPCFYITDKSVMWDNDVPLFHQLQVPTLIPQFMDGATTDHCQVCRFVVDPDPKTFYGVYS